MPFDRRERRSAAAYAGLAAIAVAPMLGGAPPADASTAVMSVSALVSANCAISATALSFGQYESLQANAATALNAAGTVSIACTKGTAPRISMDLGQNSNAGKRYMALVAAAPAGEASTLYYELYQPPNPAAGTGCSFPGTTLWGSSAGETFVPAPPTSRSPRTYSVCGTIPAGQFAVMGTYADTVVATVNF